MNKTLIASIVVLTTLTLTSCPTKVDGPGSVRHETIYVTNKPDTIVVVERQAAAPAQPQTVPQVAPQSLQNDPVPYLNMRGKLGDDKSAVLFFSESRGSGTYSYYDGTIIRKIRLDSYDAETGKLRLKAYDPEDGKYVGVFDGILSSEGYEGKFINYKGVIITFDMYYVRK